MSNAIIPLSFEDVLSIHEAAIAKFGGLAGIRDIGLLESAITQPLQSFGGVELYPDIAEKVARYAFGVASNHPFVDGNKRTATAAMGTFLRINGIQFKPRHDELLSMMMGIADGSKSAEDLTQWIEQAIVCQ